MFLIIVTSTIKEIPVHCSEVAGGINYSGVKIALVEFFIYIFVPSDKNLPSL